VSDVISSSYGNPGTGSCGVGIVSEGGVIGFGDEGGVIGFGDEGGVIGFGDEGGVIGFGDEGVAVGVVVTFFIVIGRPHIFDSVVLTKASLGLLGSHIFVFSAGEIVTLEGDGGALGDGGTLGVWA
jgi:hypothetical protein